MLNLTKIFNGISHLENQILFKFDYAFILNGF